MPFVICLVLLLYAMNMDGSKIGVSYFLKPNYSRLYTSQVWMSAVQQCIISICAPNNALLYLSSHCRYSRFDEVFKYFASFQKNNTSLFFRFQHNIFRDTLIIVFGDSLAALIFGITTFSLLGAFAKTMNFPMSEAFESGTSIYIFLWLNTMLLNRNSWTYLVM